MFNFKKKEKEEVVSFASGIVRDLSQVPDKVFASKMMGDGFAIDIDDGNIYAPISGELVVVFPTGHAYGLKTSDGTEILIHLGIDTVELNGDGFDRKVSEGQKVKQGDLLAVMDLDKIKAYNKPTISIFIVTSGQEIELLKNNEKVRALDENIIEIR